MAWLRSVVRLYRLVGSSRVWKKAVLKLTGMANAKRRRKAMKAVADVPGVESVALDLGQQRLTIAGDMDTIAVAKKLKETGKVDVISLSAS